MHIYVIFLTLSISSVCYSKPNVERRDYFKYIGDLTHFDINKTKCENRSTKQFFIEREALSKYRSKIYDFVNETYVQIICKSERDIDIYFPKCCPANYVYETDDHRCVKSNVIDEIYEELNFSAPLIKSGLEECKVTADYIIPGLEFASSVSVNPDRSVQYRNRSYVFGEYCFDKITDSTNFILKLCHAKDFCTRKELDAESVRCIKKCCPDGQMYQGNVCTPSAQYGLPVRDHSDVVRNASEPFAVYVTDNFVKHIAYKTRYLFHIEANGSIFINEINKFREYPFSETKYCMEYYNGHKDGTFFFLPKIAPHKHSIKYQLSRPAIIISCVCLMITLLGYSTLRELRNLIGKIIICYCSSLLVAFVVLVLTQFIPVMDIFCTTAGFLVMFAFLASFTWLNVMCYDIWCTLGSIKIHSPYLRSEDKNKLLWYSLHAWSIPILVTGATALDSYYWFLPKYLHPYIGKYRCLIEDRRTEGNYGYLLYFILPCGLLIFSNLILFIKTVRYCLNVKAKIRKMTDVSSRDRQRKKDFLKGQNERITVVLKLFLVMGVPWVCEIITSVYTFDGNKTLEIIGIAADTFNCLQGFFIFCIFVLKRKVIQAFVKILGIENATRWMGMGSNKFHSRRSTTVTELTNGRQLSLTNSQFSLKLLTGQRAEFRSPRIHESAGI